MATKTYTDHLGQTFESMSAMAKHWNIPSSTLERRLNTMNLTIKQALTYTTAECKVLSKKCKDHLGNTFVSKKQMCDHYNIPTQIYFGRIGIGWTVEQALTTPIVTQAKNSKSIKDHTGQEFKSISQMCRAWNISRSTFNARTKSGWNIEQALTKPCAKIDIQQKDCYDHLGNHYASQNKMCEHYGITHHTLNTRLNKLGWSLEDALTKQNIINATEINDTYGHTFPTLRDMAHYYHIPAYKLQGKSYTEEDLRKVLHSGFRKGAQIGPITVQKCVQFPYYVVTENGHEYMLHFNLLLDKYHDIFNPIPDRKIKTDITIQKCLGFPNYQITHKNNIETWSYWDIIQYIRDHNFGICKSETQKQ